MRAAGTPQASRCAPTPSEVTKGTSSSRRAAGWWGSRGDRSGRARRSTASSGGSAAIGTGTGWKRFGPAKRDRRRAVAPDRIGEDAQRRRSRGARSSARATSRAARSRRAATSARAGLADGRGAGGVRRWPPQRNSEMRRRRLPLLEPRRNRRHVAERAVGEARGRLSFARVADRSHARRRMPEPCSRLRGLPTYELVEMPARRRPSRGFSIAQLRHRQLRLSCSDGDGDLFHHA